MSRNGEVAAIADQLESLLDALRGNVEALNTILDPEVTGEQHATA